jgi:thiamine-phosphate pyrophosphorylase
MSSATHPTAARLAHARFYAILDTGYTPLDERWEATCRALLEGQAGLIQLRAKNESATERRALLERILPFFKESPIPLIINDDVELAASYPGLGLHVGQDDLSVSEARRILGPDRLLGLSTHSPEQTEGALTQADQLSYFAVGPVFATPTKPTYTPVGLELVKTVAAMQPPLPWYCIGGIKQSNLAQVQAAGGERVVVVSEILQAPDPAALIRSYRERLAEQIIFPGIDSTRP